MKAAFCLSSFPFHVNVFAFPFAVCVHAVFVRDAPLTKIVCHFKQHLFQFRISFPLFLYRIISKQRTEYIPRYSARRIAAAAVVYRGCDALFAVSLSYGFFVRKFNGAARSITCRTADQSASYLVSISFCVHKSLLSSAYSGS